MPSESAQEPTKRRGRPPKAQPEPIKATEPEQINEPAPEPVFLRPEKADSEPVEPFDAFMHRIQRVHINRDVFVVEAHHPEVASDGHFSGVFSGFALKHGPVFVKYSDGSTS